MDLKEELNKLLVKKQEETNTSRKTTVLKTELNEEEIRMFEDVHNFSSSEAMDYFASIRNINLDAKVDSFIDWYFENMVKGNYTDIGGIHNPNDMRSFIEKMAVWYELRYPDYEINRLMHRNK